MRRFQSETLNQTRKIFLGHEQIIDDQNAPEWIAVNSLTACKSFASD